MVWDNTLGRITNREATSPQSLDDLEWIAIGPLSNELTLMTMDEQEKAALRYQVARAAQRMQCNCDLDNWEPSRLTGHSSFCRIHKAAMHDWHVDHIERELSQ